MTPHPRRVKVSVTADAKTTMSVAEIARLNNVSETYVRRIIKQQQIDRVKK